MCEYSRRKNELEEEKKEFAKRYLTNYNEAKKLQIVLSPEQKRYMIYAIIITSNEVIRDRKELVRILKNKKEREI